MKSLTRWCWEMTLTIQMPKDFVPADVVERVEFCDPPAFASGVKKPRGVKAKGLRYERQVQERLSEAAGEVWAARSGPWFRFFDGQKDRFAQADWLAVNERAKLCCIAEIKLSRVPRAWWQLNRLYKPLVQELYPGWQIALLEVADKVVVFPEMERVGVVGDFRDAPAGKTSFMRMAYGR